MRRTLALAFLVLTSLIPALPGVAAGEETFDPAQMTFPVGGDDYRIADNFGVCRDGCARSHEGVDIMAPKGAPVYAVAGGVANWVSTSQEDCCRLEIDHGNGWVTRYIHLNDDTIVDDEYTTDDAGWGIAEGIVDGTEITEGQLIGWVGDSGNASEGVTHLHFELRKDGTPLDGYEYLVAAATGHLPQFGDIGDSTHRYDIDKIYKAGITYGCNPPANDMFCPERHISRGEMAAFISRTLGLTEQSSGLLAGDILLADDSAPFDDTAQFDDVAGNTFEADIDRIVTAGIGFGCDEDSYCPDRPLLREEMAELLVRAFEYDNPDEIDHFTDDTESEFEESINSLANYEVTLGCNPPDNTEFCPTRTLTRAEMASFFVRALDL